MLTRIHVNQHIIRANRRKPMKTQPPLTVKDYQCNRRAYSVSIDGPSRIVYQPDKPLACGATVWIETRSYVRTFNAYGEET